MWVLTLLAACWTPTTTSPNTMVGTVVDADGAPIAGVNIQSIEASTVTSPEGAFGLSYKDPTRFVWLTRDQVTVERHYQPDDLGQQVRITVPAISPRPFSCEMDTTCEVRMVWDLGGGTKAIVKGLCDTEERRVRLNAPASGLPISAVCRDPKDPGAPEQPLHVADGGSHVRITPPLVALDVAVAADPSEAPTRCEVLVDGNAAARGEPGHWTADVFGTVQLEAVCDGVPVTPKRFMARAATSTTLRWHRVTPELDLRATVPEARTVWMRAVEGTSRGWEITLTPNERGTFTLPRLPEGAYLFTVNLGAQRSHDVTLAADDATTDLLQLVEVAGDDAQPAFIGALRTSGHVDAGVVPVTMLAEAFHATTSP